MAPIKNEKDAVNLVDETFPSLNHAFAIKDRYRDLIASLIYHSKINYNPAITDSINRKIIESKLQAFDEINYTKADVSNFINAYNLEGCGDYAVGLVAENYNKSSRWATFFLIVINTKTRTLTFCKRYKVHIGEYGFENAYNAAIWMTLKRAREDANEGKLLISL